MTVPAAALLHRIAYDPGPQQLAPIPWPEGMAPTPAESCDMDPTGPFPPAGGAVVFWTTAEAMALADVLTPGHHHTTWVPYRHDWASVEAQLTGESPAKDEGCAAYYWPFTIGSKTYLAVKSNLHLATDGLTVPVLQLWQQLAEETGAGLIISGGTAGGIGASVQLGDVFVVGSAKFNCTERFKAEPWAQRRFATAPSAAGPHTEMFPELVAPNARALYDSGIVTRDPTLTFGGDVETVDYFAFADATDHYEVAANDPQARCEEMDDATLPLALSTLDSAPDWLSVRTASDPQVPSDIVDLAEQKAWAERVYDRYGYACAVGAAIAAWCVVAPNPKEPEL